MIQGVPQEGHTTTLGVEDVTGCRLLEVDKNPLFRDGSIEKITLCVNGELASRYLSLEIRA
jgi:hypothetical protein